MNTAVTKLAEALKALAANGQKVDDLAGNILRLGREFNTRRKFAVAVRQAYEANGWHSGRGRPTKKASTEKVPVPATVKTYVWEVSRALSAGLRVYSFKTFYELRRAMALRQQKKLQEHRSLGNKDPELAGVRVMNPDKMTGHLVHDLVVIMHKLERDKREHLQAGLERLLKQYAPPKARATFEKLSEAAANQAEERQAA